MRQKKLLPVSVNDYIHMNMRLEVQLSCIRVLRVLSQVTIPVSGSMVTFSAAAPGQV